MVQLRRYQPYAPAVLRIGLSLVFLWFGINQLLRPDDFMGYLPDFVLALDFARSLIYLNGGAELLLGALLLVGLFVRPVALLLTIHLCAITVGLGYNDIAVRDFGLMLATFSVFLGGRDIWSIDCLKKNCL